MITVEVTEKNLLDGVPVEPEKCPVALALKDKGFDWAHADRDFIAFGLGPKKYWVGTPLDVLCHMDDFDDGNSVLPFSFEIKSKWRKLRWKFK